MLVPIGRSTSETSTFGEQPYFCFKFYRPDGAKPNHVTWVLHGRHEIRGHDFER